MGIRTSVLGAVNSVLGVVDMRLQRVGWDQFSDYIPFNTTLSAAQAAGMSVGDYIESSHNVSGTTDLTIETLAQMGVFDRPIERVCEIGPGSGRYLERVSARCRPSYYEIYETAAPWRDWLVQTYGVVAQTPSTMTLNATPDHSIDFVHSHKVFPGLPILTLLSYMREMIRVVKAGGYVAFDVLTEECLSSQIATQWLDSQSRWILNMVPKQFVIAQFEAARMRFLDSFTVSMLPGITEYLVFAK